MQRDEGTIDHHQVCRNKGWGKSRGGQFAGVGLLHHHHSPVAAQLPGELASTHVHGVDPGRASLQQTVGETPGRRAQIDSRQAGDVEVEMSERVFQLESATANESLGRGEGDPVVRFHRITRLPAEAFVDPDFAGEDGAFGLFAAFAEPELNQCLI